MGTHKVQGGTTESVPPRWIMATSPSAATGASRGLLNVASLPGVQRPRLPASDRPCRPHMGSWAPSRTAGPDQPGPTPLLARAARMDTLEEPLPAPVELPVRMNMVPHPREMRQFFYGEVINAVKLALEAGVKRMSLRCTIPETNPDMDVYRIGTILELVREVAFGLVQDGACVKVSVQQGLGDGVFQGLPLSLSGVRQIMEAMDWGDFREFVRFGEVGAKEIDDDCEYYVLVCPQNVVGGSILSNMEEMVDKAEASGKIVILFNPLLKDVPSAGGLMGVRGRQERMDFAESFTVVYHFRLLYYTGSYFPIVGALRFLYGGMWEVYKRVNLGKKEEVYQLFGLFKDMPSGGQITECIQNAGKKRKKRWW
eukprot:evm.model.scf_2912EXC.1 EVM.evm.TU.scf_2912EXC.1   scf_2912EXC:157-4040(+)